mmetsp:Transcript_19020/g.23563  ORF Transcript_19020/g.23563 Transcript_19020/m.23563 type:complete len:112 (+) Transcript_19020:78-413(+)
MFCYLDRKLTQILATPNTYYQSGICLELVRTQNRQDHYVGAKGQLERARKILSDHFGGSNSPSYLDFLLRKVEFLINVILDANATNARYALTADELEEVKADLASSNDAFI